MICNRCNEGGIKDTRAHDAVCRGAAGDPIAILRGALGRLVAVTEQQHSEDPDCCVCHGWRPDECEPGCALDEARRLLAAPSPARDTRDEVVAIAEEISREVWPPDVFLPDANPPAHLGRGERLAKRLNAALRSLAARDTGSGEPPGMDAPRTLSCGHTMTFRHTACPTCLVSARELLRRAYRVIRESGTPELAADVATWLGIEDPSPARAPEPDLCDDDVDNDGGEGECVCPEGFHVGTEPPPEGCGVEAEEDDGPAASRTETPPSAEPRPMVWCACGETWAAGKWTACPSCGAAPGSIRATSGEKGGEK